MVLLNPSRDIALTLITEGHQRVVKNTQVHRLIKKNPLTMAKNGRLHPLAKCMKS